MERLSCSAAVIIQFAWITCRAWLLLNCHCHRNRSVSMPTRRYVPKLCGGLNWPQHRAISHPSVGFGRKLTDHREHQSIKRRTGDGRMGGTRVAIYRQFYGTPDREGDTDTEWVLFLDLCHQIASGHVQSDNNTLSRAACQQSAMGSLFRWSADLYYRHHLVPLSSIVVMHPLTDEWPKCDPEENWIWNAKEKSFSRNQLVHSSSEGQMRVLLWRVI